MFLIYINFNKVKKIAANNNVINIAVFDIYLKKNHCMDNSFKLFSLHVVTYQNLYYFIRKIILHS